ncbi:unnamed protein product [Ilex paraguariensis]|uniref:Uncharacterized protein n=1 Tax=Ilex paraguariensis TaxID=185542 RepID=A0ABC8RXM6_9AQUA
MANSLTLAPLATAVPISTTSKKTSHFSIIGAVTTVLGLNFSDTVSASVARRPPLLHPPEGKTDPKVKVKCITTKVLASKKRKEAMKESMAKLERGESPSKNHLNSFPKHALYVHLGGICIPRRS